MYPSCRRWRSSRNWQASSSTSPSPVLIRQTQQRSIWILKLTKRVKMRSPSTHYLQPPRPPRRRPAPNPHHPKRQRLLRLRLPSRQKPSIPPMVKKSKKSDEAEVLKPVTIEAESKAKPKARKKKVKILDPIGDLSDGEAQVAVEPAVEAPVEATEAPAQAPVADIPAEASSKSESDAEAAGTEDELDDEDVPEFKPRPPAKLERLQKILAKAGVASRRKAEEMIEQGRVQRSEEHTSE